MTGILPLQLGTTQPYRSHSLGLDTRCPEVFLLSALSNPRRAEVVSSVSPSRAQAQCLAHSWGMFLEQSQVLTSLAAEEALLLRDANEMGHGQRN